MTENKIDDGGLAFPHPGGANDATVQQSHLGMTLRDWFAGQELIAMGVWAPVTQAEYRDFNLVFRNRAERAYRQADAMIAARKGGVA